MITPNRDFVVYVLIEHHVDGSVPPHIFGVFDTREVAERWYGEVPEGKRLEFDLRKVIF